MGHKVLLGFSGLDFFVCRRRGNHVKNPTIHSESAKMHFTGQESQAFGPSQEIDARQETRVDDQRTQRQVGQREEEGARLARQEIRRQSLNGEDNEKRLCRSI